MTIDKQELRKLAEEATPGPWWNSMLDIRYTEDSGARSNIARLHGTLGKTEYEMRNAEYIAAANPSVVLSLLDEIDELKRLAKDSIDASNKAHMMEYKLRMALHTDFSLTDLDALYELTIEKDKKIIALSEAANKP